MPKNELELSIKGGVDLFCPRTVTQFYHMDVDYPFELTAG